MKERIISSAILIPLVVGAALAGGLYYVFVIGIATLLAGLEFAQLARRKEQHINLPLLWAIILLWIADTTWGQGRWLQSGLVLLTLTASAAQLFRHTPHPAADWALTLAGGLYLGIGSAYLLRLRALPDGLWWTLITLPGIWIADSGAFFIGKRWGRHKLAPSISPGKTWEGYIGSVLSGGLGCALLAGIWSQVGGSVLPLERAALLGVLLGALTPLGDLFVSLLKREVGVKDTSNLIPGHGGVLDRIDSLIWAGVIACTWLTGF